MEQRRVEIVEIHSDIPNAIIVDGKKLKQVIEQREAHHSNWKIHLFFIGMVVGYTLTKLI